ncbi:Hypothetical predicted protein [Marmota monax]|uniref:Uncharacterized protein n=1 Tax=Marmota monax TaxID=9995 RepID=A0A5E4BPZ7_MARMO|nr:hypothetical protein GHT09_016474 [Marmota monax]VTJ70742.1 Hypothetical predicted protein [Marmota monax]
MSLCSPEMTSEEEVSGQAIHFRLHLPGLKMAQEQVANIVWLGGLKRKAPGKGQRAEKSPGSTSHSNRSPQAPKTEGKRLSSLIKGSEVPGRWQESLLTFYLHVLALELETCGRTRLLP